MNSPVIDPALLAPRPILAPRFDMYTGIHKALRHFMTHTLVRVGSIDVDSDVDVQSALTQLAELLDMCLSHLDHENQFVHAALEARRPGASHRVAEEHVDHLQSIDALRVDMDQLRRALPDRRHGLALRLYRHLALFVSDNLAHMHYEETVHNTALWALYTDEELKTLHHRLLASLDPQESRVVMQWMAPALTPAERARMGL